MKLLTKIYLAFGFIMLIFAFVTASYVLQSSVIETDVQRAITSSEILRLSETMAKAIIDSETGVRGFQVSDNEAFLDPYYKGRKEYTATIKRLSGQVTDTLQTKRLAAIDETYDRWLHTFAARSIKLQKRSLQSDSGKAAYEDFRINVIREGVGRKMMDSIRAHIDAFDKHELKLKNVRMAELNGTLRLTNNLAIALTIICLAVGFMIIQILVKAIRTRLEGLATMATEITNGDFKARVVDKRSDEISVVSKSLNTMAWRLDESFTDLQKSNDELDQFAYVVSHDLKAPLRAINSLAEWIEEDLGTALDPDVKRNIDLLRGRVLRMENLINGILEYSRIGRKELPQQHFSSHKLVTDIVDSLSTGQNVHVDVDPSLPELNTEHIFMHQVFSNLISNAIKYNDKPNPHVHIGARELSGNYEFWVEDNGPGISKEYHEKVFGIFQTMEARDTKESTGVGLAIVKKIIDEKGGSIHIESEPGLGSKFVFSWPKAENTVTAATTSLELA
ncbi:sensor histidine kinase [Pontibacter oryzae]|uniref:histidine kinase n=1 Tax=Pontibacter oryzae TaxID=2304593 RepID=A0A399SIL1_9BACT|nr:ATP-binding protein [Pontibacter oryzae]RIJ41962.1 HAMP domain-containing protein [Pontibacter oryzae]